MVRITFLNLVLLASNGLTPEIVSAAERVICCGGSEVFVLAVEREAEADKSAPAKLWRWQAADSPEIPETMRAQFRTTDECKPFGDRLLITSSSGGVALIQRSDKKCLFYTSAKNAHSACLLPDDRLAVASSYGGDELLIFSHAEPTGATPLARMKLVGAHGAVWDEKRSRLWALGGEELHLVEVRAADDRLELVSEAHWPLPSESGHDLFPCRDGRQLFVTTGPAVYRFDTEDRKFAPFEPLAKTADVKSIAEHPRTGRIVFHQGNVANKTWWSDTIRFLEPAATMQLPGERLYKIRWDVEENPVVK